MTQRPEPLRLDSQAETAGGSQEETGALDALTPAMAQKIEVWPIGDLSPYDRNPRTHSPEQVQKLASSIIEFGFVNPILVSGGIIRAGHGRLAAAQLLGLEEVPVVVLDHLSEQQARAFTIADNRLAELAGWDEEMLASELAELSQGGANLDAIGFSEEELESIAGVLDGGPGLGGSAPPKRQGPTEEQARGVLAQRFGVPPFSVLDAKQGYWQERKAAWLALGLRSELGREENLLRPSDADRFGTRQNEAGEWVAYKGGDAWGGAGTSVFDPVLCELAYRWWCPEGGSILDPFAGGSVRGIVAARLGFSYCGIELREEQVAANCEQAARILGEDWDLKVQWIHADSKDLGVLLADSKPFDFLFTCPPYYDLERYSDDTRDLSNAPSYREFLNQFNLIMEQAVGKLAPDRFACLVVSDIRDKDGCYRGFERHSQVAMEAAGAKTYNLAVLSQPVGSAAIRAGKIFGAGRKLPRNHQAVQVFAKGRPWEELKDLLRPTEWDDLGEPAEPAEPDVPRGTIQPAPPPPACSVEDVTPLELVGGVILKRDDSCRVAGVSGGKVRSCWRLAQGASGLVTAGSRSSPQGVIVASIAAELGIPCRVHMPAAPAQDPTPEMAGVQAAGGEVVPVPRGRNNVIIASARRDAAARGWTEIPFGMECREAVEETARQVRGMREKLELTQRIVVPVGSGMSLAGILTGLLEEFADAATGPPTILGVVVGASPIKRLDLWAPTSWRNHVELVESGSDYHKPAGDCYWHGVRLDSGYEAKCLPFLRPEGGDLFWVVGIRAGEDPAR